MAKAKPDYKKYVEGMLECCVCLETVRDPHTLQGCFHSVCAECLEQLLRQEQEGLTCPVCRTFSARENIRANFFVRGLAEMHISHKERRVCEQCPASIEPSEACSKCLDCKMNLCSHCREAHLNVRILQGHRILPLTEATELIVDQLVFCTHHPDKPIELFCETCHRPVCIMCTVLDHSGHKCQTIQATLDKMVPQWENNIKYIDDKLETLNNSSDEVEKNIQQTRAKFQDCMNQIDEKAEERITEIRVTQKQMKDALVNREKQEMEKLEKVMRDLAEKKRDGENVRRVVRASLDRARHASLMTELLQEGLGQKMESVRKWGKEEEWVKVDVPKLEGGDKAMDENMKGGLLGRLIYNTVSFLGMVGSTSTRVWDVDAKEYLNNKFKLVKEIQLAKYCARITLIKDHVWVPLFTSNLQIYNKSFELINTIEINSPESVAEASNGDIFIACSYSGLYFTTGIDKTLDLISTGDIADVYAYNRKMYSLNRGKNMIQEYICEDDHLDSPKLKWSLVKSMNVHNLKGIETLIVDQSGFYVTSRENNMIYHYSEAGQCLQKFTDSLNQPYLCGIDRNSNLIVANRKLLNLVQCNHGKAVTPQKLKTDGEFGFFHDLRLENDGSLWLLYNHVEGKDCISKYEVVNE